MFITLGLACAATRSVLNLPYTIVFFISAIYGFQSTKYTFLVIVLAELGSQWILIFLNFEDTNTTISIGILSTKASYVSFWLKTFAFVL